MDTAVLIEDDPVRARALRPLLQGLPGLAVAPTCTSAEAARALITAAAAPRPQLVLLGLAPGGPATLALVPLLRRHWPQAQVLVLAPPGAEAVLLAALRAGAHGGLTDPGPAGPIAQQTALSTALQAAVQALRAGLCPIVAPLLPQLLASDPTDRPGDEAGLTPREAELLGCLLRGLSYAQSAAAMGVRCSTVQTHVQHLYRKLGVRSKIGALQQAQRLGLWPAGG